MNCNIERGILNICRYEFYYFLKRSNVVGVGLGYKTIKGIRTCEKAIVVLVKKKVPKNLLNKEDLIPSFYKSIKTDVVESGEFRFNSLKDRVRPVTGGYAIGPLNYEIAGSYGALVADNERIYMLSNNHVMAGLNIVPLGTPIIQPAKEYGGQGPQDIVGFLSKYIIAEVSTEQEIRPNYVDAALARIDTLGLVSPAITFAGVPTGIKQATLGMFIEMVCATSVIVTGEVILLGTTISIELAGKTFVYVNQITIDSLALQGDSGAVFLNEKDVVGLHFATSNYKYSLANPIETVLSLLQVQLVIEG